MTTPIAKLRHWKARRRHKRILALQAERRALGLPSENYVQIVNPSIFRITGSKP